jgi:hypothetical protein
MHKYPVWATCRALVLEKVVHIITIVLKMVEFICHKQFITIPFLSPRVVLLGAVLYVIVMG